MMRSNRLMKKKPLMLSPVKVCARALRLLLEYFRVTAAAQSSSSTHPHICISAHLPRLTQQIHKQPIRARHTGRQFPEKIKRGIDEPAFAIISDY